MWRPDSVFDGSGHLDEGVIHAWLDDALDPGSAQEVGDHATACDACAGRVAEARGLIAGASRLLGALDVESRVVPDAAPAGAKVVPMARRRWTTRRVSLAAAAVLVFVAGSVVLRDRFDGGAGVREAAEVLATAPEIDFSGRSDPAGMPESEAAAPAAGGTGMEPEATSATARSAAPGTGNDVGAGGGAPTAGLDAANSRESAPPSPPAAAPLLPPAPAPAPRVVASTPLPSGQGMMVPKAVPSPAGGVVAGRARAEAMRAPAREAANDSALAASYRARRDSAMERLRRSDVQLDAVVVTGLSAQSAAAPAAPGAAVADRSGPVTGTRGAWVIGCWQIDATEASLEFPGASLTSPVAAMPAEWHPGARIAAGQWGSISWRFERDSVVRVQEWESGRDLLIRPGREVAMAWIVRTGGTSRSDPAAERVTLLRRGESCP